MKKFLRSAVAAALSLCMVFGASVTCQAATEEAGAEAMAATAKAAGSINGDVTSRMAYATFTYPEAGHHLKVDMRVTIKDLDKGTSTTKSFPNNSWGNITSVRADATAGTGYSFIRMKADGYVDDVWNTSSSYTA